MKDTNKYSIPTREEFHRLYAGEILPEHFNTYINIKIDKKARRIYRYGQYKNRALQRLTPTVIQAESLAAVKGGHKYA